MNRPTKTLERLRRISDGLPFPELASVLDYVSFLEDINRGCEEEIGKLDEERERAFDAGYDARSNED